MIRSILRSRASAWHKYGGSGSPQTLTRFTHRRLSSSITGTNNAKGEIIANKHNNNANATRELVKTTGVTQSQESLSRIGSSVADSSSSDIMFRFGIVAIVGTLVLNYKEHRDKLRMPSQPRSSYAYMNKLALRDKYRLDQLLKKKGLDYSLYPYVRVASQGQKIITSFTIPAICNIPDLTRLIVSNLGLKVEDLRGSKIERRKVDWLLTNEHKQVLVKEDDTEEDLTVLLSHYGNESKIEFIKGGSLTDKELGVFVNVLKLAGESNGKNATSKKP